MKRSYELVVDTAENDYQRTLKSGLLWSTFLAATLGAFLGFCVPVLALSFVREVLMNLPRGPLPWPLASCGMIIGAIIGVVLVRRSIG